MKKNQGSSELAAKIAAAANQPAGRSSVPAATLVSPQRGTVEPVPAPSKRKKADSKKTEQKGADTKAITLRPTSALLNTFVLKASERTREEGRVISAQEIMLETLERSVL